MSVLLRGAIALGLVGATSVVASAQQAASAASLVFDGVTVVDVEQGKLLPAQRVVIVGARIQAIGDVGRVKTPTGAQIVDARGKYLIPGLWDMHSHASRSTEFFYPLFLVHGVTGFRDAGSPVPLDTLRLWRGEILAGTRVGPPRQILSGQSIRENSPDVSHYTKVCDRGREQRENRSQTCVTDSADARHVIDSLKAAGADMIKPRAVWRAMYFVIAAEARRLGIPFGGHTEMPAITASDSGARIIDHMQDWILAEGGVHTLCVGPRATIEQCQPVAERLRRNGTWLAGYVQAGFTPLEALQTATLNPAKMLRGTDSLGTVAPGKLADLVVLDADPLADIAHTTRIRAVVANGRYYDRAALDGLLADVQARAPRKSQP